MTERIQLNGGRVFDPAHGVEGAIRTIWIEGGRIVAEPAIECHNQFRAIDLSGRVVMPGGIDMHSHIVGPKVNAARKMQPELYIADYLDQPDHVRGRRSLPTIESTAIQYLAMGYTTVFDAAVSPLATRHVHAELEGFPIVDAGFFVMVGNHHRLLQAAAENDVNAARRFLGWLLGRTRAFAPKLVNPGGVESWKSGRNGNHLDLDETIVGFETTPRQILHTITTAANQLNLPHPVHIHCNNLGIPGNASTTLETMRTLDGLRAHLTHIQFQSYGGDTPDNLRSAVDPLVEFVNSHPEMSVDVGQILFGETTSMTGDGPLGHFLSRIHGQRWYSSDTEVESGCGVSPIAYSDKKAVHAWQWLTGLEWFLKTRNPWQIALSTDHPNGASFLAYPKLIRMLMDSAFRNEQFQSLPDRVRRHSDLLSLDREYSLSEICIITRAAPARLLGLVDRGHLSRGAVADITVYTEQFDREQMFQSPWMVIKNGIVVVSDHELIGRTDGSTLAVATDGDAADDQAWARWFAENYSLSIERFGITPATDFYRRQPLLVGADRTDPAIRHGNTDIE